MTQAAKPYAKSLASTMVLLRELKGMGLREHARHLGLKAATLCRIEQAKGCDLDTLVTIHKATGVKYDTLLGDTEHG